MVDELKNAFAHPVERAKSLSEICPLDRISLRDYIHEVEIGAFQSERGSNQRIKFNIVVEVVIPENPDDDVDLVFSYDTIISAINKELSFERINLLETLAEKIANNILSDKRAKKIFIRIEKLDRGPGALGVEIVRSNFGKKVSTIKSLPACYLIVLGKKIFQQDRVTQLIDVLSSADISSILLVPESVSKDKIILNESVKTRVTLLSIDQNAWVLASRNKKCQVVETRTELDWLIKNKQIGVWSPSKLFLSVNSGSNLKKKYISELTLWLSGQLNVKAIFSFGEDVKEIGKSLILSEILESNTIPSTNR